MGNGLIISILYIFFNFQRFCIVAENMVSGDGKDSFTLQIKWKQEKYKKIK